MTHQGEVFTHTYPDKSRQIQTNPHGYPDIQTVGYPDIQTHPDISRHIQTYPDRFPQPFRGRVYMQHAETGERGRTTARTSQNEPERARTSQNEPETTTPPCLCDAPTRAVTRRHRRMGSAPGAPCARAPTSRSGGSGGSGRGRTARSPSAGA